MTKEETILTLLDTGELEIDSEGRIWRLARRGGNPNRGGIRITPVKRHRAEWTLRDGYLLVGIQRNGEWYKAMAHRIVWTHHNGPILEGLVINHINGVKDDNRPENLEMVTPSGNRFHAVNSLGAGHYDVVGSNNPRARLTEAQVLEIRQLRAEGWQVKDIAAEYGVKDRAVSAIVNRRTWRHI